MAYRFSCWLFLLGLLAVLPAGSARACHPEAGCGHTDAAKSCCARKQAASHPCPAESGHNNRHCPCTMMTSGPCGAAIEEYPPLLPPLFAFGGADGQQAFRFIRRLPEAVYFSIWQPPQLAGILS